jgi:uncharacterized membrane protein YbhN (UPF0104 family)
MRTLMNRVVKPPAYVRWTLAIALLGAVLVAFDPRDSWAHLDATSWWIAVPAVGLLVSVHLLGALTWRLLVHILSGVRLGAAFAVRAYYIGQAFGGLTPANIAADAYRVRALTSGSMAGWTAGVAPVVVQRLGSYAAMAAAGLAASLVVPVAPLTRVVLVALTAFGLAIVAAAWLRRPGRAAGARPDPLANRAWLHASAVSCSLGLLFHVIAVAAMLALVRSVTASGEVTGITAALVLARVATLLPLTPSGLGFQEAALAVFLTGAGVSGDAAVAIAALARLAAFATIAVGFLLLGLERLPFPRRPARPAEGPQSAIAR